MTPLQPHRPLPRLAATIATLACAAACGDGGTSPPPPPPDPPRPTTLAISPATAQLTALAATIQLTAEIRDQNGQVMTGTTVTWASSAPAVATVSAAGLVTAVGTGITTVTAMAGAASGQATVTVMQSVDAVVVSPAMATAAPGDTLRLVAEAVDGNGHRVEGAEFAWTSSEVTVATVDSAGLVRARVPGGATITARIGTIAGTADLTVALPHIPPNPAVDEGTSHSLQFGGIYVSHAAVADRHPSGIIALAYADLNGDGRTDIFYSPLDGSPDPVPAEVYINNGMGGFDLSTGFFGAESPGGVHPRKVLPGDFNGDGKPDLFVLDHGYDREPFAGAHPYALLSSDNGYVLAEGLADVIGFHHGGASADIDADGDLDVLVTDNFTRPFFFVNDGNGGFVWDTTRVQGIEYTGIFTAELVDVDLDGYVDLIAAGHEYDGFATQILWGDQSGVFSTLRALILPAVRGHGTVVDIDVADTDGDGDRDVVLNRTGDDTGPGWYNGYYLQLLEQTAARSFSDKTSLLHENQDPDADWISWVRIADIDEDGDPDVFADEASRRLIWKNNGSGGFHPGVYRAGPPNPAVDEGTSHSLQNPPFHVDHSALRAGRPGWADAWAYGDFDGDGHPDIFYAPVDDPPRALPAELYVNDGEGNFSLDDGFMGGNPPALLGATKALPGDYNGDGRLDVFVLGTGAMHRGEAPYLILSSGSGHVLGDALDEAAGVHFGGASADVDADGDLDVLLTDVNSIDPPSILLNDGSGSFAPGGVIAARGWIDGLDRFLIAAELVDVDGDGYSDLLVGGHEQDEGRTQVIWGDSSGVYHTSRHTTLPAIAGHGVILDIDAADFDRDGDKDLVVSRTGDDTGVGFHKGYYLQLVENLGERRFGDATARLHGNRDDNAGSLAWIRVYDFDGDTDLDIVVDDYSGTDLAWRNDGTGGFRPGARGVPGLPDTGTFRDSPGLRFVSFGLRFARYVN